MPSKTPVKKWTPTTVAVHVLAFVFLAPVALAVLGMTLLFTFMFLSWCAAFIRDHIPGRPVHLQRQVFAASADRKTMFAANVDGSMVLVDIPTGRILQKGQISPEEYISVEPKWENSHSVRLWLPLRYPLKVSVPLETWDAKTGSFD